MEHPYTSLPPKAFWRKSVGGLKPSNVDPVGKFDLKIGRETKVATAGSCFAQHIARHLRQSGFNYFVAEPGHPILPQKARDANNYGLFSCRYGNIYTARQLRQLMERSCGRFEPREDVWFDALMWCATHSARPHSPAVSFPKRKCASIGRSILKR